MGTSLAIKKVSVLDDGFYHCITKNEAGQAIGVRKLNVNCKFLNNFLNYFFFVFYDAKQEFFLKAKYIRDYNKILKNKNNKKILNCFFGRKSNKHYFVIILSFNFYLKNKSQKSEFSIKKSIKLMFFLRVKNYYLKYEKNFF